MSFREIKIVWFKLYVLEYKHNPRLMMLFCQLSTRKQHSNNFCPELKDAYKCFFLNVSRATDSGTATYSIFALNLN